MVSLIISIFSLIISIFNLIYLIATNIKKLDVDIINFTYNKINDKFIYIFDININNKSRQPIAINSIILITDEGKYKLNLNSRKIAEYTSKKGKKINCCKKLFSSGFPVSISGLLAKRQFYEYDSEIELNNIIKIQLITNRGKISKKGNFQNKYIDSNAFLEKYKNVIEAIGI